SAILVGNTSSLQGNPVNNGSLTFDQGSSASYPFSISGTGSFIKSGGATLTIPVGESINQTGGGSSITVAQGILNINGTVQTPTLTINPSGTVSGSGTITANVTNNGTMSPGNSPGPPQTIVGNYTQS